MNGSGSHRVRDELQLVNQGGMVGTWSDNSVGGVTGYSQQMATKVSLGQLLGLAVDLENINVTA